MSRTTLSSAPHARSRSYPSIGWVIAVLMASIAVVACVIVAAAWVVGGRSAPMTASVQELLPPEPRQSPPVTSGDAETEAVSAVQPPEAPESMLSEAAAVRPGDQDAGAVVEIPVQQLNDLKSFGWAVPFLDRSGFSPELVRTSSAGGERTVHVHFSDGTDVISVAETRAETGERDLSPLRDKLDDVVELSQVRMEAVELSTGHESTLYISEESEAWAAGVETPHVRYLISASLDPAAAEDLASWVMITDRSRVHLSDSAPGPADRLERGFDEILTWFDAG
ncbi:hypothetical protein [Nesterenkonia sphaerica]|uniref:Uncharacterized protein n=1 Tax=Nesterenkonia sphaerica TaxID=1804988 RepID=A0A5R9AJV1_9MICC|nr:hypothetical protein [Nesterenkonia sphaerica]TLP78868.1 hypothetical protein FEF27_03110 [Nesterenkonia sphaerica]